MALFVVWQQLVGVGTDMTEGIEADEIGGAEGRTLRPGGGRAGDGIDFLDGHTHLDHMLNAFVDRIGADPVGDEVGGVLGVNYALAEALAEEIGHTLHYCRVSLRAGHDLHQPHIARRIEEVGSKEILADLGRQHRRHLVDGEAAGVGGENGARREVRHEFFQEIELDRHVLDHHLDHPVALLQFTQVVRQVADLDLAGVFAQVKRRGFHLHQPLQAVSGDPVADRRTLQGEPLGLFLFVQFLGNDIQQKNFQS
ncbi:MAG: hypothetical protein ACD_75C02258G0003, partial [uncultured bacterium]